MMSREFRRQRRVDRPEADRPGANRQRARVSPVLAALLTIALLVFVGCSSAGNSTSSTKATNKGDTTSSDGKSTSTTKNTGSSLPDTGEVSGLIGETIEIGKIKLTVKSLEETVNPAPPPRPASSKEPSSLGANRSFYQASVRIENTGEMPVPVDVTQFSCAVGDGVSAVDPVRSGPPGRSLLKGTSIDLLLTFMGDSGYQPELLYHPPETNGVVRVKAAEVTSTTG